MPAFAGMSGGDTSVSASTEKGPERRECLSSLIASSVSNEFFEPLVCGVVRRVRVLSAVDA